MADGKGAGLCDVGELKTVYVLELPDSESLQ